MKRYISLTLVAVILVVSLAVPSYAAETEAHFFEVLDFSSANNGSNFQNVSAGVNNFSFELPGEFLPYGFDILVTSREPIQSASINFGSFSHPLTVHSLGNRVYRLIGDSVVYDPSTIVVSLEYNTSGWVDFHSVKFFTSPTISFNLPASGVVSYGNGEEDYFYFNSDDDYSGALLPGSSHWQYDDFRAYITVDDFSKFDRLDLQLYLAQVAINSVTVSVGNQVIPFSTSYLDSSNGLDSSLLNISIDSTNLFDSSESISITLLGTVAPMDNSTSYVGILYSSGFVYSAKPNSDLFFFRKYVDFFANQFDHIFTLFGNLTSSISTNFSTWFGQLSSWISNSTETITSTLNGWFAELSNKLSGLDGWLREISGKLSGLEGWLREISNKTSDVISSIGTWGKNIVDAINGDASDADEFKQQVDDSNKELNDMAAVMDSFTTPDVNSINVDVGSYISPTDLSSLSAPMGMLFESNIVTTCIMISIIMGTVMFVLYGKR